MKLNNNLIIGAALLGGGAYYAFKKGLFGKKTETTVFPKHIVFSLRLSDSRHFK